MKDFRKAAEQIKPEVSIVMSPRFLTESEVSDRTHISVATLRQWRLENRGPKFHKFGSLVRYPEEDLTHWERAQPSGGEPSAESIKAKSVRNEILLRKSG
jgi:predicted DNA-binding transcriptional regulator AlpA